MIEEKWQIILPSTPQALQKKKHLQLYSLANSLSVSSLVDITIHYYDYLQFAMKEKRFSYF